jgi:hypothetical protein
MAVARPQRHCGHFVTSQAFSSLAIPDRNLPTGGERNPMAVLKPRTRLVYFRVSEDEFERFSSLCERHHTRSISELARQAMERLIAEAALDAACGNPRIEDLSRLIMHLSNQLEELIRATSALTPQSSEHPEEAAQMMEGHCGSQP